MPETVVLLANLCGETVLRTLDIRRVGEFLPSVSGRESCYFYKKQTDTHEHG